MLMVIMAAFAVLYPFVQQYVSNYQQTTGLAIQERFIIEDVWFTTQDNTKVIRIHLYNYGEVEVTLVKAYIKPATDGTEVLKSFSSTSDCVEAENLILSAGEDGYRTIYYEWEEGKTYHITIITERGTIVEGDYKA